MQVGTFVPTCACSRCSPLAKAIIFVVHLILMMTILGLHIELNYFENELAVKTSELSPRLLNYERIGTNSIILGCDIHKRRRNKFD